MVRGGVRFPSPVLKFNTLHTMKKQISALKRKIKTLEAKHSEMHTTGFAKFGGNMNAVRFQLSMIQEQIMFAERDLRDLQENF